MQAHDLPEVEPPKGASEKWRGHLQLRYSYDKTVLSLCAVFVSDGHASAWVWDTNAGTYDSLTKKCSGKWLNPFADQANQVIAACLLDTLGRTEKIGGPPDVEAIGQTVRLGPYTLTKKAARTLSEKLRQTADDIREPGCPDPFAHWEGHCGCGSKD